MDWGLFQSLGFGGGFVLAMIGVIWRIVKYFVDRKDKQKAREDTEHNLKILRSERPLLKKTLEMFGDKMDSSKILVMKIHNGGGRMHLDKNYQVSVQYEFPYPSKAEDPSKLELIEDDYKRFIFDDEYFDMAVEVEKRKVWLLQTKETNSPMLQHAWAKQGTVSTILIWLGTKPDGYLFVSLHYQSEKTDLKTDELQEIDVNVNELRNLYKFDKKQFIG